MKKNITIIEDDESINRGIELILGNTDYDFRHFYRLSDVDISDNPDLIILDINLPDGSGMDFLKYLRSTSQVPVLILTANDTEMDEVMGLELGANDYVTKPFSVMVLRLRVQKLLVRKEVSPIIEKESLYIDFEHLIFKKENQEIELSKTEIRLLRYFIENAGYTLTREKIIDFVWQNQEFIDENALSVIIKRLRNKTEDSKNKFIRTVYGIGYIWKWERPMFIRKKEYEVLNKMLDDAISGEFEETNFDESELSKVQTKLKRYLTTSSLSEKKIIEEKCQLNELITNISHQTKTPLTNIVLYAELLEEQATEKISQEYVKEIVAQSNKLKQLIQAFVKMSRLETGIYQFEKKTSTLSNMIMEMSGRGKRKADEKNIQVIVEMQEEIRAIFDRKWTIEAIYNILDNAIKYSSEYTSIYISIFQYELFAGIRIRDEGIGIEEDDIPRIFGRFFRGTNVHDKEGIGVGLYLSREIVEGQGGYIKVFSKPGFGSTFEIFFPKE